jgi:hypothetical protein
LGFSCIDGGGFMVEDFNVKRTVLWTNFTLPTCLFQDVLANFKKLMEDNPDTPQAVAAISTLIDYINQLHSGKNLYMLCEIYIVEVEKTVAILLKMVLISF